MQATDSKTVCCLCCESDPVSATFRLDKVAFVPGETIVFDADIQDGTGRGINSSVVKLIMVGSRNFLKFLTPTKRNKTL